MTACRRLLGEITAPALVIQSLSDPVVHSTSARTIVAKIGSAEKNLVELPGDRHVIIRGQDSDPLAETISTFIERIGSSSALALQGGS